MSSIDKTRRRMYIKPTKGLRVRMHHNLRQFLPEGGAWVPMLIEWQRALADGDVCLADPPAPPKKKTPKKRKKTKD